MGSQSQAQAPQQAHARPMANHAQNATSNGNGLMGSGGSISRMNSLARQGSIYSVTLDELQRTLIEPGVNFGSMNMDEFLKNIWTLEESQAMASAINVTSGSSENTGNFTPLESSTPLIRQPSLVKQPSLSISRTMSRKTVDEVWRDIIKSNPGLSGLSSDDREGLNSGPGVNSSSVEQRSTYGEMTLEAFLLKAGVVVKDGGLVGSSSTPYTLFQPYPGNSGTGGASDRGNESGERMGPGSLAATLSLSPANGLGPQTDALDAFRQGQAQAQQHAQQQQVQGQVDWFRNIQQQQAHQQLHQQQQQQIFQAQADAAYAMSKRVSNGGMLSNMSSNGGYTGLAGALAPGLGQMGIQLASPMALALPPNSPAHSPASDGVGHSQGNGLSLSPVGNYGVDGSMRGRKRGADGTVEKVVERRQRRMIKNRESAARSRARKQAYTVELEAEVTQLKVENDKLRKQNEEEAFKRKKMVMDSIIKGETHDKRRALRRTRTGPW